MTIDKFGQSLGLPGAPLLPATLRTKLESEPLPPWMTHDLKLEGAGHLRPTRFLSDAAGSHVPDRVVRAITFLLSSRREAIQSGSVHRTSLPPGLAPEAVPWSTRTRNSLRKGGVLRTDGIDAGKTFGDIFSIGGAG